MDILFFLTGCLGLAETIDLFCGKDFLILYRIRSIRRNIPEKGVCS
ncbi:hypothetical protein [Clostridium sp. AF21-20LB]